MLYFLRIKILLSLIAFEEKQGENPKGASQLVQETSAPQAEGGGSDHQRPKIRNLRLNQSSWFLLPTICLQGVLFVFFLKIIPLYAQILITAFARYFKL